MKADHTIMHVHYSNGVTIRLRVLKRVANTLDVHSNNVNEKALRETQTLRAGCSKAEPKIFAPSQTPFPGARGTAKI